MSADSFIQLKLSPRASGVAFMAATAILLIGCSGKSSAPAAQPLEVGVIKVTPQAVEVQEDYPGQTEAIDTVEIRARVGGILERQAYGDGASVKKGDLLFVIDPQPYIAALASAKAALAQAQANHVNSKQALDRAKPLFDEQAISQQDLDSAVATEAANAAAVDAAQAQVQTAQLNLGYTTIRASRDGVVSKALFKPGSLVDASTSLLTTLYSVDPIYVNFTIGEQKLYDLKNQLHDNAGLRNAKFGVKLVDGSEYEFKGKLDFVDAAVSPDTGTLQLRLTLSNSKHALRAGEFVRVMLPAIKRADGLLVPQQAVQEMQGNRSVYVVDSDGKAAYRAITTSARLGTNWLVDSGLEAGDTVIVEGTSKVHPGTAVKPVPFEDASDNASGDNAAAGKN